MFTLYRINFAPARKSNENHTGYDFFDLFTHKNGDFGAISVTERSCASPIFKVERYISDRCTYYTG